MAGDDRGYRRKERERDRVKCAVLCAVRKRKGLYEINHRIMQHRGLRSGVSRSRPVNCLLPLASSSSTTSCGLTVMWTTFGASRLNLLSIKTLDLRR